MVEGQLASRAADGRSEGRLPPAPSVAPWLVIPYEKGMKQQAFYNPCELLKARTCQKIVPELNGKLFWQKPSHGGWLVMLCHNKKYVYGEKNTLPSNSKFGDCFLWNPVTLKIIRLPSLLHWITSKYCIVDCTLSSPPSSSTGDASKENDPTVFFVFASKDRSDGVPLEHVLVYCSLGEHQWRNKQLHDIKFHDPSGFRSLLSVKSKLYAMYINNNWHLEIEKQHDQTLTIRRFDIQKGTVFEDVGGGGGEIGTSYTHYIESGDEVFGVWMKLSGDAKAIVTSLQILKLDFSSMAWAKVTSLGDKVLFIGNNTIASCSAAAMGLKRGCLFYVLPQDKSLYVHAAMGLKRVLPQDKSLYVHNIENNCTKCILPFSELTDLWFSPEWILMPMVVTNELRNATAEDLLQGAAAPAEQDNPLSNIAENSGLMALIDVVENLLHPVDYIHFRSLCKAAQSKMPATGWRLSSPRTKKDAYLSPWLVFLTDNDAVFNFVNPMHYNEKYFVSCSALVTGAVIRSLKDGWLLMTKGKHVIFFYNPFTRETIQLPDLPTLHTIQHPDSPTQYTATFHGFSFSSLPTCGDCMVFAISDRDRGIYTTRRGKDIWSVNDFPVDYEFPRYILINNLLFGRFVSPVLELFEWEYSPISLQQFSKYDYVNYLVSCDEENVFLVHVQCPLGKLVSVYRFDLAKDDWVEVKSLGKRMLFVSSTSGFSAIAPPNSHMENKIYFPKFHGKGISYYSLDTGMYHATCSECTCDDFSAAYEYLNTSWIQPNWCTSTHQELDWMALSS